MKEQRINMDIDKELWKAVGIRAIEKGITKKELVTIAIQEYLDKKK